MKANQIYVLTIVYLNGSVIQEETQVKPTLNECYITNNGDFVSFETIIETNKVIDRNFIRSYVTCIEKKPTNDNLIGVTQTKFISCPFSGADSIKYLENEFNKFLFETRFTHLILDISYTPNYIVVKYKLRNEMDVTKRKAKFESYQNNGIEIKYQIGDNTYFTREETLFEL